ncbi:MAG: hypothetical protein JRI34_02210 [Deltaproteobacteria bacterium]|nr:hypothetical protein [Deltaproteobacteria bacterium]
MTFLSKQSIRDLLYTLIEPTLGRDEVDNGALQPSSIELRLGNEVYLSGEKNLVLLGADKKEVAIKPGELAILLTEEKVNIPRTLMGFISIRNRYKSMGLINISGFHVDPGFKGKLTFSVYNAGPNDIILRHGERLFLLFLAKLDRETEIKEPGMHDKQEHILSDSMNMLTGKPVSPLSLDARLEKLEARVQLLWGLLAAVAVGIVIALIKVFFGK